MIMNVYRFGSIANLPHHQLDHSRNQVFDTIGSEKLPGIPDHLNNHCHCCTEIVQLDDVYMRGKWKKWIRSGLCLCVSRWAIQSPNQHLRWSYDTIPTALFSWFLNLQLTGSPSWIPFWKPGWWQSLLVSGPMHSSPLEQGVPLLHWNYSSTRLITMWKELLKMMTFRFLTVRKVFSWRRLVQ